jgi:hypothetical protein
MNADSTFIIGATHSVCQDYAVARESSARGTYAILSDGCSTSPDTDIGARLLVKAAERILHSRREVEPSSLHESAAACALAWSNSLHLTPQAVDATLLTAHLNLNELIVMCSGDGVVAGELTDGSLDVYAISYPSGYPLYPAYLQQPERLEAFRSSGATREIRYFRSTSIAALAQPVSTTANDTSTQVFTFSTSVYKYVALISDGIHSFFNTRQTITGQRVEPLSMTEMLRELLAFKTLHGAFVARRVKKFLKDCRANGRQHADDLSLAVIHLEGAKCSPNMSSQA